MAGKQSRYLILGLLGVVSLLVGLAWDAVLHSLDPNLAAEEGIFAWRNPGHVLLGVGIASVVVGLIGASVTTPAGEGINRFARPAVRRGVLAGGTVLALGAAAITSWAATSGHGHEDTAGAHAHGDTAGAHAHGSGGEAHSHDGVAGAHVPGPDGRTPGAAAGGHPHEGADGHTHATGGHTDAARGHTTSDGRTDGGAGGSDAATHRHSAAEGSHRTPDHTSEPRAHAHPSSPPGGAGEHQHPATSPSPSPSTSPEGASHSHHEGTHDAPPTDAPSAEEPLPGRVVTLRYGPFALPPAGMGGDADHANLVFPNVEKPCENCFILSADPDLVHADGSPANYDTGVMLHHAVFFNTGRVDTTCGDDDFFGRLGERFLASGNERTKKRLPAGFGYHLGDDPVNAIFHVMNHSSSPQTVFFTWTIRWVPDSGSSIRPAIPVWLDVNNCRTSEYAVPAGPSSEHWQWKSTLTGRILTVGGHVHDGGIRTTLTNATTRGHLCTSWASYGTNPAYMGSIESMSRCTWDSLGVVRAGDTLDLESVYNASAPVGDAMGIMVAYVYETDDLDGGTAPPPAQTGAAGGPPPTATPPPAHRHHH